MALGQQASVPHFCYSLRAPNVCLPASCRAIESFRVATDIQPHDSTFLQLGKVYTLQVSGARWGTGVGLRRVGLRKE